MRTMYMPAETRMPFRLRPSQVSSLTLLCAGLIDFDHTRLPCTLTMVIVRFSVLETSEAGIRYEYGLVPSMRITKEPGRSDVVGVTELEGVDAALGPTTLVATTVKVYAVPPV